jgi:hypothetical protein
MYNFATEAGMLQHAMQKAAAATSSLQYLVAKLYIGGPCDAMDSGSDGDALGDVPLETCEPHTHTSEGAPRRRFSEPGQHTTVKVCVCVLAGDSCSGSAPCIYMSSKRNVCPQHVDTFETEVTKYQSTLPAKQSMIVTTKYEFVLCKNM